MNLFIDHQPVCRYAYVKAHKPLAPPLRKRNACQNYAINECSLYILMDTALTLMKFI